MTPTKQETAYEAFSAWLLTTVAAIFIFNLPVLEGTAYTAAAYVGLLLAGYAFGQGSSRAKLATSEEYGLKAAKYQQEQAQLDLREQLDPAGRLAYDDLQRAMDRLESGADPQDV